MAQSISPDALHGHWVHSHEEDTATEMVFRPAGYAFPPSRGRQGFALQPDGSYLETAIGPTDKPQKSAGTWTLQDGDEIAIRKDAETSPRRILQVTSATPNKLVIRK